MIAEKETPGLGSNQAGGNRLLINLYDARWVISERREHNILAPIRKAPSRVAGNRRTMRCPMAISIDVISPDNSRKPAARS